MFIFFLVAPPRYLKYQIDADTVLRLMVDRIFGVQKMRQKVGGKLGLNLFINTARGKLRLTSC